MSGMRVYRRSGVVISGGIGPLTWVISIVTLLITLLITTLEPPRSGFRVYLGVEVTRGEKSINCYFIMVPLRKKVLKYVQSPVTRLAGRKVRQTYNGYPLLGLS